jgi:tRNA pseudouridine(55) synthase
MPGARAGIQPADGRRARRPRRAAARAGHLRRAISGSSRPGLHVRIDAPTEPAVERQTPSPEPHGPEPRGLIVLNKPQGITSRKALNLVERRLGLGPLGHCGSLDPLATGVLVLVVGKARKVQDLIVRGEKIYDMTVTLGARSDTDDSEGQVVPVPDAQPPARERIEQALAPFRGEIMQIPPTYSAVKIEGRRMHREARKGRPVDAPPRLVTVHS